MTIHAADWKAHAVSAAAATFRACHSLSPTA